MKKSLLLIFSLMLLLGCTTGSLVSCSPEWDCNEWSGCTNESDTEARHCVDNNACGVFTNKPFEVRSCNESVTVDTQITTDVETVTITSERGFSTTQRSISTKQLNVSLTGYMSQIEVESMNSSIFGNLSATFMQLTCLVMGVTWFNMSTIPSLPNNTNLFYGYHPLKFEYAFYRDTDDYLLFSCNALNDGVIRNYELLGNNIEAPFLLEFNNYLN